MKDAFMPSQPTIEMTTLRSSDSSSLSAVLTEAEFSLDTNLALHYQSAFTRIQYRPTIYTLTDFQRPKKEFKDAAPENVKKVNVLANVLWVCMSGYLDTRSLIRAFSSCKQLGLIANDNGIRKRLVDDKNCYEYRKTINELKASMIEKMTFREFYENSYPHVYRDIIRDLNIPRNNFFAPAWATNWTMEEKKEELYNNSSDGQGFIMVGRSK